ncbi:MAG: TIGR00730 family Rossman fold protein [Patescibacteria group bacterium]
MIEEGKKQINIPEKKLNITPLTVEELDDDIRKTISKINQEFVDGLNFLTRHTKSVTVFGSTRFNEDNFYYKKAESIAGKLSRRGYDIITGGGPSIMEAANKGAFLGGGEGHSIGFNIELPHEQAVNPYVEDGMSFNYFFSRKFILTFSSEAFIFFPGGFGTMDEFFEILTLVQTKKIIRAPIILFGSEYWKEVDKLLNDVFLKRFKTIDEEDLDLYVITDNEEEAIKIVENAPMREG